MILTAGQLADLLQEIPADTPLAVDTGMEYRGVQTAVLSPLGYVDDDENHHDVTCLVVVMDDDGRRLDEALEKATVITGSLLRDIRVSADMTQQALADNLGVAVRSVGNWERGPVVPAKYWDRIRSLFPAVSAEPVLVLSTLDGSNERQSAESAREAALALAGKSKPSKPLRRSVAVSEELRGLDG